MTTPIFFPKNCSRHEHAAIGDGGSAVGSLDDPGAGRGRCASGRGGLTSSCRQPPPHFAPTAGASCSTARAGPYRRVFLRVAKRRRGQHTLVSIGVTPADSAFLGSFGSGIFITWCRSHSFRASIRAARWCDSGFIWRRRQRRNVQRPGGPVALITNRCLFCSTCVSAPAESVHPGIVRGGDEKRDSISTGPDVCRRQRARAETLKLMRETVAPHLRGSSRISRRGQGSAASASALIIPSITASLRGQRVAL